MQIKIKWLFFLFFKLLKSMSIVMSVLIILKYYKTIKAYRTLDRKYFFYQMEENYFVSGSPSG